MIVIDYYQRPFLLYSQEIASYLNDGPHKKRFSYWSIIPEGTYGYVGGTSLIHGYYKGILREVKNIVGNRSRMYWLHLSRRILPYTMGENKDPETIYATRKILDSAIEKYAKDEFCEGVGITKNFPLSEVLDGLLMAPDFALERQLLDEAGPQVVLKKFNTSNLVEYYLLEKLMYEIWKCSATLRSIGKGAKVVVDHSTPVLFYDLRSKELSYLLDNYDNRNVKNSASRKGVILKDLGESGGELLVPYFNIWNLVTDSFNELLEKFSSKIRFPPGYVSNFIPTGCSVRGYVKNNRPLFNKFFELNHVNVFSIFTVIAALLYKLFFEYITLGSNAAVKVLFMRGYTGPISISDLLQGVSQFVEEAMSTLDLTDLERGSVDIEKGVRFLTLRNTEIIDLLFPAPVKMLIPVGDNQLIVDYTKVMSIMDDLMFGVRISNENFKGDLFEELANEIPSYLPTARCEGKDGTTKQIDYSIGLKEILVICECKLKEVSIGYYKGKKDSIDTRTKNVVDKSINEADIKARWLASHSVGTNYDISKFKYILPVGLSAFKEYIPSQSKRYWITKHVPRVLTVDELTDTVKQKIINTNSYNLIKIKSISS